MAVRTTIERESDRERVDSFSHHMVKHGHIVVFVIAFICTSAERKSDEGRRSESKVIERRRGRISYTAFNTTLSLSHTRAPSTEPCSRIHAKCHTHYCYYYTRCDVDTVEWMMRVVCTRDGTATEEPMRVSYASARTCVCVREERERKREGELASPFVRVTRWLYVTKMDR